jgi:hypothetical protein
VDIPFCLASQHITSLAGWNGDDFFDIESSHWVVPQRQFSHWLINAEPASILSIATVSELFLPSLSAELDAGFGDGFPKSNWTISSINAYISMNRLQQLQRRRLADLGLGRWTVRNGDQAVNVLDHRIVSLWYVRMLAITVDGFCPVAVIMSMCWFHLFVAPPALRHRE